MFLSSGHGQVTRSCQSPPNKCYSLFRQERARSSGTAITLQGPGWEETDLCSKRAKCLDPPSRLNWGSQAPRTQLPLAASGHRSARAGPADCVPGRWPRHQTTGGDGGEAHHHLTAWARGGQPGEGSWAQQDTAPACSPGPPRSAASLKPREREGPGEKAEIRLLTSLSATHHSADWWLK